jgi:S1-C subfamily serine protease
MDLISRNRKKVLMLLGVLFPALALACQAAVPRQAPVLTQPFVATQVLAITPAPVESQAPAPAVVPATAAPLNAPQPTALVASVPNGANDDTVLEDLYRRVNPSVVNITVYSSQGGQLVPVAQGSGFVYDANGDILTNAHVVHGMDQVEVTFSDNTVLISDVVGEDLNSDLAVVRVKGMPAGANPLPLGDLNTLAVGQTVVAIGNPFGLEGTLTRGIISALGRNIPALTPFSIPQSIQTDAAINPGNSGGPLLNLQGQVIGVNAQIETNGTSNSNVGVGFAIPVSMIQRVVPDLIQKGAHDWAWLGVQGGSLTPPLIKAMNLPVTKGAYIDGVIQDGPSAKAGLRGSNNTEVVDGRSVDVGGDVVTAIDGQTVSSFDDILIYIALQTHPGQEVTLTILRNGKPQDVKVTLEKRPANLNTTISIPTPSSP